MTLEGEHYIRVFTIEFDMRPLLRVVSLKTYLRKAAIVHCHWTNTNRRMSYRLFEEADHAKLYAKYRPTYPLEVYDEIRKYCQHPESSGCDVALDVACGSGQSTFPLMDIVQKVVGMDISEKQVTEARQLTDEVEFRVGPAEDLGFQGNETVDLVTIAQAIHWLDTEKFYGEVTRVLRPGGSLVVYGYGNGVLDREEAQQTLQEYYNGTLDGYWSPQRRHIDDHLATFELPFKGWSRLDSLTIKRSWDLDAFIGYLSSWSGWQNYLKSHPGSSALKDLGERFRTVYTDENTTEVTSMCVTWPIFMLMGRKPRS